MWLWKKFWNTDIIGKIYILIILFIVVVATITVITRYKNASTNQIENEQKNEIIGEEITFESNVIDNNVTTVANIKEDTKEETTEQKTEQSIKDITKQNIETKVQENSTIKTSSTLSSNKTIENQDKKDVVPEDTKDLDCKIYYYDIQLTSGNGIITIICRIFCDISFLCSYINWIFHKFFFCNTSIIPRIYIITNYKNTFTI